MFGGRLRGAAFVELQRRTTSAENAIRLMTVSADIDVTDLAPRVLAPTLVLHAANDHRVPGEQGELFGALIPDARFVRLESDNHILLEHEPAWAQFVSRGRGVRGRPAMTEWHAATGASSTTPRPTPYSASASAGRRARPRATASSMASASSCSRSNRSSTARYST